MRYQIDYRWILTTTVVIGVAAAGTAAIVRQGNGNGDLLNADSAEVSLARQERVASYIEPARLSHGAGASSANLPAFEPEALPPMLDRPDHSNQAAQFSQSFGPSWSSRTAEFLAARADGGGGWLRDARYGGVFGWQGRSIGGGGGHSAGQTPASNPHAASPSDGSHPPGADTPQPPGADTPQPPGTNMPRPPAAGAPGAGLGPGRPSLPPSDPPQNPKAPPSVAPSSGPGSGGPTGPLDAPVGDPSAGGDPTPLSPTPEPASLMLIGTGLVGIYGALRRRAL